MIINQAKIDFKKNRIQELIKNNCITEEDIELLLHKSFDDIINSYKGSNEKQRMLYKIYFQPYLLCKDGNDNIDLNLIVALMIKRYNMELNEISYMYNDGTISLNEYYRYIDNLVSLYFNTSEKGKLIYQNYGGNFELSNDFYNKMKTKNKHLN